MEKKGIEIFQDLGMMGVESLGLPNHELHKIFDNSLLHAGFSKH